MGAAIKMTPGARIADIRARLDAVVGITADDDWEVDREKPRGEDEYYHVIAFVKLGAEKRVATLFDSMNADSLLSEEERRAILNFAAAARSDVPWLLDQVVALRAALEECARAAGPFSLDPLEHAKNCIEAMRETARAALTGEEA